jgi:hypothetical protein
MTNYLAGHVKHHPETHQVAIRTRHQNPDMAWSVATSSSGARHCVDAAVQDWQDLYVPPPLEESTP